MSQTFTSNVQQYSSGSDTTYLKLIATTTNINKISRVATVSFDLVHVTNNEHHSRPTVVDIAISIDGTTYVSGESIGFRYTEPPGSGYTTKHITGATAAIPYDADGSKSVSISFSGRYDYSGSWYFSGGGTFSLDSIDPSSYAVTYYKGVATGGTVPSAQTKVHGTNLTLVSSSSLVKSSDTDSITTNFNGNGGTAASTKLSSTKTISYSLAKWNTNSSGTGTDYSLGATYSNNAALSLYPKFTSGVTYSSITLPSASREGYSFKGWYTAPTGGTKYGEAGDTKTPTSSTTLYAQWQELSYNVTISHYIEGSSTAFQTTTGTRRYSESFTPTYVSKTGYHSSSYTSILPYTTGTTCKCYYAPNNYSVVYKGNGNTGGYMFDSAHTYDESSNLTENSYVREYYVTYDADGGISEKYSDTAEYSFKKWNTRADGSGTSYLDEATILNLTSINNDSIVLYAQWDSDSVVLPNATKAGYTFAGWYDGEIKIGDAGDLYTPSSAKSLIAKWIGIPYTLTFDANGGTGTMESVQLVYGTLSVLPDCEFSRVGMTFMGWNTRADGSGTSYKNGESVINLIIPLSSSDSITLYAQWQSTINLSLSYDEDSGIDDGVAIGGQSSGGNKFEVYFDTYIGTSATNFRLFLNGEEVGAAPTPITDEEIDEICI